MKGRKLPPVPWAWTRHVIASERWHCPPWVVDEAPVDEVLTELKLMAVEAKTREP